MAMSIVETSHAGSGANAHIQRHRSRPGQASGGHGAQANDVSGGMGGRAASATLLVPEPPAEPQRSGSPSCLLPLALAAIPRQ